MSAITEQLLDQMLVPLRGLVTRDHVTLTQGESLSSIFAVSDIAQASIATAGAAVSALRREESSIAPIVTVDRNLANSWFFRSIRPIGWSMPEVWEGVTGDYQTSDGWIRLHTNKPNHLAAALRILEAPEDREIVRRRVEAWNSTELETAIVEAGGAAAAMHSREEWLTHPQGEAVRAEPLVDFEASEATNRTPTQIGTAESPLAGIRVLDLTRVLAGPVGTRLLAGWGADVLRIDPPGFWEPSAEPEVTLGKHVARLDLRTKEGKDILLGLLAEADVFVHGFRRGALDDLGLGKHVRESIRPGLVDVSLTAYGWTGPWTARRGFDSLVQMSNGIAHLGQKKARSGKPLPLPVQALDHATGYLMASAAITGLILRQTQGIGSSWHASLARTGELMIDAGISEEFGKQPAFIAAEEDAPIEQTPWGDAKRIPPHIRVEGAPLRFRTSARPLGTDPATWS
ncbi:CoA transferase [Paramicrobacterium chengjingii]|uniref:CoA transferase n=1 Tax=Paramicrobacterium chengjingii TaxID=2769067 RepID=A0ABX6YHY0_9MICO|nr:CoA transferase [Microbacterium chengjingii]QPZ38426.1 CoA transferase [Microbacterium chengjingii]